MEKEQEIINEAIKLLRDYPELSLVKALEKAREILKPSRKCNSKEGNKKIL